MRSSGGRLWPGLLQLVRRVVAAVAASLVCVACATNPATGKRELSLMSEQQEIAMGQQSDADVRREMGVYSDRSLQEYVSSIGLRLASGSERPDLPWHFTIVDVPAINAFALPGGYIYITRGILPFLGDEAQLAGVLGHEIGHVTARHASRQYSRATGAGLGLILGSLAVPGAAPFGQLAEQSLGLLFLKNGRDDELEADSLGVRYAARGGWDPAAIPAMLTTLGRIEEAADNKGVPNWLATHPAAADRVEKVQAAVSAVPSDATFKTEREGYVSRLDGVIYGDDPAQGVVRGSQFLHPGLRFAVQFPQGWSVTNGQTAVVASRGRTNVAMVLQPVDNRVGRNIREVAERSMASAGFQFLDGTETSIAGLESFVGIYEGSIQDLGRVNAHAAHILYGRDIYLLAGIAPVQVFGDADTEFVTALRSFRPLTRGEAEDIHPDRVDLYTARDGDTWQTIADRRGAASVKPAMLAIMNGHRPDDPPRPGERLKIVVAG